MLVMMGPNNYLSLDLLTNTWSSTKVNNYGEDVRPYMGAATVKSAEGDIFFVGGLDKDKSSNRVIRLNTKDMT